MLWDQFGNVVETYKIEEDPEMYRIYLKSKVINDHGEEDYRPAELMEVLDQALAEAG